MKRLTSAAEQQSMKKRCLDLLERYIYLILFNTYLLSTGSLTCTHRVPVRHLVQHLPVVNTQVYLYSPCLSVRHLVQRLPVVNTQVYLYSP